MKRHDLGHSRGAGIGTQAGSSDSLQGSHTPLPAMSSNDGCLELPASLTAGTPSLSVWPLVFHGHPLCGGSCQQAAKALYCPYLELLSLKLALLLQNMFILVSSPSWLPDQAHQSSAAPALSPGPGRAGQGGKWAFGERTQEGTISLPKLCPSWGIAVGLGEKIVSLQTTP